MKKTRLIALVLCVVMLLTSLTGCGTKTVMKINGIAVPEGVYTYYYASLYVTGMSYGYETSKIAEMAVAQTMQHVAIKELAKELKLEMTAMENKSVIDSRNAYIEQQGKSEFNRMLQAMNMTKKQYEDMDNTNYMYSKIADYYFGENGVDIPSEEELINDYKENYIRATHILLSTQKTESDEDRAAVKKTAEEVLAKAKAGENFYDLIREYGEDPGVAETPEEGYYFTTGQMVTEFETAAFALAENEISDLVETQYGYHIILRLPMDDAYVSSTVLSDTYYYNYCSAKLADMLNARIASYEVEFTKDFSKIDATEAILYNMGY